MSKWKQAAEKNKAQTEGGDTTPVLTMNLRQVVNNKGEVRIEQLVEHRNKSNMVVNTEWVTLPIIYEVH